MSQHDYSLANQAGAAFRSDLNNALGAVVSLNSGATEPATTFAYMMWVDTTTGYLKQRNSTNNGWNILNKLDQDSLAALQTQTFTAFTTTGSSPTFVLTPVPAITAYAANQRFRIKAHASGSTGSNRLNFNTLGAKYVKQYDSTGAKASGVLVSGQLADVEYDGTDFVILNPLTPTIPASTDVLVQRKYDQDATAYNPTMTNPMVLDTSLPQSNEGVELLSVTITASNASNIFRISWGANLAASGTVDLITALFKDSGADAIASNMFIATDGNRTVRLDGCLYSVAGDTSSHTFKLRVGTTTGGTLYANQGASGIQLGGTMISTLTVEEFTP